MTSLLRKYCDRGKLLILGFGREGRSTLQFIRTYVPEIEVGIADRDPSVARELPEDYHPDGLFLGADYLDAVAHFDVIMKSPGIKLPADNHSLAGKTLLSQTHLFLEQYRNQIIGITGTKGKSTTASLTFHLLKESGKKAVLVGNIGRPPFDLINVIDNRTIIVYELSANQLEQVSHSPRIAILLNLFPEHLDFFGSIDRYYQAKLNIAKFQQADDVLIWDDENPALDSLISGMRPPARKLPLNHPEAMFDETAQAAITKNSRIMGKHNRKNTLAAAMACKHSGVINEEIVQGIASFIPLEHRLEYTGTFCGIRFYNDSISTIPESTIEALKAIPDTRTLILGGYDRGLDYTHLLQFVAGSNVDLVVFTGPAGQRMMPDFQAMKNEKQQMTFVERFGELPAWMLKTPAGKVCLLSPAASSYDNFRDFEERGRTFKKMAETLDGSCRKKSSNQ